MMDRQSFVIAIANPKGGVAKTTTAISLSGALVLKEKEVLVLDLDSQANLTLALGKDPSRVRRTIADVLFDSATMSSISQESNVPGLDFVPANAGMLQVERFLPLRKNYETFLRRAIDDQFELLHSVMPKTSPQRLSGEQTKSRNQARMYDFVLLDCPPSSGAATLIALTAADLLIIPTQPEYFSAWSLRSMTNMIHEVRRQNNQALAYRILITMCDRRNRVHQSVSEQIQANFCECLFETVITTDTKLRECQRYGLPITHYDRYSRSALQYESVAQELIDYVENKSST